LNAAAKASRIVSRSFRDAGETTRFIFQSVAEVKK
jgi:hypothetical protein